MAAEMSPGSSRQVAAPALIIGVPGLAALAAIVLTGDVLSVPDERRWIGAVVGALCGATVGIPAAFYAISSGRHRLHHWILLGAAAGATPLLVPLLGGVLRAVLGRDADLLDRGGGVFVAALLRAVGIPTPRGGRPSFLDLEIVPVSAGALAAILFWLLALSARPLIVRLVGAVLVLAVVVSARLWLFR